MAGVALRFAHASNLRIDVPLRGAGPLSDAARRLAEDAPATAWERIVEACVDRDVAFLLLTPRTLVGASVACDRRHLLGGLRQLNEYEIPVYWSLTAGESLSRPLLDELPDNVTLLTDQDRTATLLRGGRVVAEFNRSHAPRAWPPESRLDAAASNAAPLRIRIADTGGTINSMPESEDRDAAESSLDGDYFACWGETTDQTRTVGPVVCSEPGTPCARTADETGCGGINLVEWDGSRVSEVLRVPTATVRWHRCPVGVFPETSHDELVERLQFALLEREAAIGEQLWIVEWQIVGSGPEFEKLHGPAFQHALNTAVDSVLGNGDRLQRVYRWKLRRRPMSSTDAVSQRLLEWLAVHAESECESIARDLACDRGPTTDGGTDEQSTGLRADQVRDDAEQLLAEWLATPAGTTD